MFVPSRLKSPIPKMLLLLPPHAPSQVYCFFYRYPPIILMSPCRTVGLCNLPTYMALNTDQHRVMRATLNLPHMNITSERFVIHTCCAHTMLIPFQGMWTTLPYHITFAWGRGSSGRPAFPCYDPSDFPGHQFGRQSVSKPRLPHCRAHHPQPQRLADSWFLQPHTSLL